METKTTTTEHVKPKPVRENLGKFFYDLARTSFAAMVAGGLLALFTSDTKTVYAVLLLLIGVASTTVFSCIGYNILKS